MRYCGLEATPAQFGDRPVAGAKAAASARVKFAPFPISPQSRHKPEPQAPYCASRVRPTHWIGGGLAGCLPRLAKAAMA
jgi:hypothetical protein